MSPSLDSQSALEYLETALETSCGALMALELLRPRATEAATDLRVVQVQLTQTIAMLRQAIEELRAGRHQQASLLAFGFVLAAERGGPVPS